MSVDNSMASGDSAKGNVALDSLLCSYIHNAQHSIDCCVYNFNDWDVREAESHPWVLTGSTNWSFSGDNYNDENSIFIQSEKVTNLYFQEWLARYKEAGGKFTGIFDEEFSNNSTLEVSTNVIINYTVITLHLKDNFKFPFIDVVNIEGQKVASIPL